MEMAIVSCSTTRFGGLSNPIFCTFEHPASCSYNESIKEVATVREKKNHLYLDSQERSILLHSLVELKNQLIQQGRYTDCIDELIFKMTIVRTKKINH
jgi:hypothetical protein